MLSKFSDKNCFGTELLLKSKHCLHYLQFSAQIFSCWPQLS